MSESIKIDNSHVGKLYAVDTPWTKPFPYVSFDGTWKWLDPKKAYPEPVKPIRRRLAGEVSASLPLLPIVLSEHVALRARAAIAFLPGGNSHVRLSERLVERFEKKHHEAILQWRRGLLMWFCKRCGHRWYVRFEKDAMHFIANMTRCWVSAPRDMTALSIFDTSSKPPVIIPAHNTAMLNWRGDNV